MADEKSSSLEIICQRLECFSSVNKVHRGALSGKSVKTEISVEFGVQRQIPLILFPVAALTRRMISPRSAAERRVHGVTYASRISRAYRCSASSAHPPTAKERQKSAAVVPPVIDLTRIRRRFVFKGEQFFA